MDSNLNKPEGLSPAGERAYKTIIRHFGDSIDDVDTGGCKAFYSPEEWRARGEQYGCKSELIVVYDGGMLRQFFNMDAAYDAGAMMADFYREYGKKLPEKFNPYASYENMQAALAKEGLYFEECTGWYCAVYPA